MRWLLLPDGGLAQFILVRSSRGTSARLKYEARLRVRGCCRTTVSCYTVRRLWKHFLIPYTGRVIRVIIGIIIWLNAERLAMVVHLARARGWFTFRAYAVIEVSHTSSYHVSVREQLLLGCRGA